jgi:hypothetical protein
MESMVCPWQENGNVARYLERCGDVVGVEERFRLLVGVAEGLRYCEWLFAVICLFSEIDMIVNSAREIDSTR